MQRRALFLAALGVQLCVTSTSLGVPQQWAVDANRGKLYARLTNATWADSQTEAQSLGGNLATIRLQVDNDFLSVVFPGQHWIGFNDAGGTGVYSWASGGGLNFTNWAPGQPSISPPDSSFAYIDSTSSGNWFSGTALDTHSAIAELPVSYTAIQSVINPANKHTYTLVGIPNNQPAPDDFIGMDWFQARSLGRKFDGNLVTINNAAENTFIKSNLTTGGALATARRGKDVWTGLSDHVTEGSYKWSSGQPLAYTDWAPGQPDNAFNEDFIKLDYSSYNGQWNDFNLGLFNLALVEKGGEFIFNNPGGGSLFTPGSYADGIPLGYDDRLRFTLSNTYTVSINRDHFGSHMKFEAGNVTFDLADYVVNLDQGDFFDSSFQVGGAGNPTAKLFNGDLNGEDLRVGGTGTPGRLNLGQTFFALNLNFSDGAFVGPGGIVDVRDGTNLGVGANNSLDTQPVAFIDGTVLVHGVLDTGITIGVGRDVGGSTFRVEGVLEVGVVDTGSVTVYDHGNLTVTGATFVGAFPNSTGLISVAGTGTTLTAAYTAIGASGEGTLEVGPGASVTLESLNVGVFTDNTGAGNVFLRGGNTFIVNQLAVGIGSAGNVEMSNAAVATAGTLTISTPAGPGGGGGGNVNLYNTGTRLTVNGNAYVGGTPSGSAGANSGTLWVHPGASVTVTGTTTAYAYLLSEGKFTGNVDLQGGTLGGAGSGVGVGQFVGSVTGTGVISPGIPFFAGPTATLKIDGNVTLNPGSNIFIQLGGTAPGSFDKLIVTGNLLSPNAFTFGFGYVPTPGDSFQILSAGSTTGSTATDYLYSPELKVNTSSLLTTGVVTIEAQVPTEWIVNASGSWQTHTNWSTGTSPAGANVPVLLGSAITAPRTVTLNSPVTIGKLTFDNLQPYTVAGSTLTFEAFGPRVVVNSGNHVVDSNLAFPNMLGVQVAAGSSVTFNGPLSGFGAVTKSGAGTANFNVSLNHFSDTIVTEGTLLLTGYSDLPLDFTSLQINSGAKVRIDTIPQPAGLGSPPRQVVNQYALILSAISTPPARLEVAFTDTGNSRNTNLQQLLIYQQIIVDNDGAPLGSRGYFGHIDLGDSDMIVRNGDLAQLRDLVRAWWNSGARDGFGLGTSAAASLFTTLAVRTSDLGNGFPEFLAFDGIDVAAADVVVKYTYLGDTDLNGLIDASDLNAVLNGMTNGLTGWEHGDTNYDGVVDGLDWENVLLAHAGQGGVLSGGFAPAGSIPEPTVAMLLALPLLLPRRLRR
jgi:T5SS/PEP-CTERM-associated repeat protein